MAGACYASADAKRYRSDGRSAQSLQPQRSRSRHFIIVRSHIGYGAPNKQDNARKRMARRSAKTKCAPPNAILWLAGRQTLLRSRRSEGAFRGGEARARGGKLFKEWTAAFAHATATSFPIIGRQMDQMACAKLPDGRDSGFTEFPADDKGVATRDSARQGAERDCRAKCPG